ncbi:MAG: hypothetical protein IPL83_06115 [Bdellovibrionales bacterium]|nr:hypothetical protein [Bdellovibrionales bacterium]
MSTLLPMFLRLSASWSVSLAHGANVKFVLEGKVEEYLQRIVDGSFTLNGYKFKDLEAKGKGRVQPDEQSNLSSDFFLRASKV